MKKIKFNLNLFYVIINSFNLILLSLSININMLICIALVIGYLLINYIFSKRKININKFNFYFLIISLIFNIVFILIKKSNIMQNLGSVHEIKNFILSTKEWGIIVFYLIEFLQVIILPIPAFLTILAGVNIWGVWKTIIICGTSVIIASCFAFLIGRKWGTKAIIKLMGNKKYDTYKNILNKNSKLYLSLMFIFPFFPDDLLCILAGTTDMKFYHFILISLFTRPLSIIITALLGEYFILFFENNSIKNILIVFIILALILLVFLKYKKKIAKLKNKI